jgi:hypothetical protein
MAGAAAGGLLGLSAAYGWKGRRQRLNDSVPADLSLGTLSRPPEALPRNELLVDGDRHRTLGAELRELFALVSHRLMAHGGRRLSVMSTQNEGITCLVAINFAEIAKSDGLRTLLVVPDGWIDDHAPSTWCKPTDLQDRHAGAEVAGLRSTSDPFLDILETGVSAPELTSLRLTRVLADLDDYYDVTLILAPSMRLGGGATSVASLSGACLVLTDGSNPSQLSEALRRVGAVDAQVLGVVIADFELGPSRSSAAIVDGNTQQSLNEGLDAEGDGIRDEELIFLGDTMAVSNRQLANGDSSPSFRGRRQTGGGS